MPLLGHSLDPGLTRDPALAGLSDLPVCRVLRGKNQQSTEKRGKRYKLGGLKVIYQVLWAFLGFFSLVFNDFWAI